MKNWSFYDAKTGWFLSRQSSGPDDWKPRCPPGSVAIQGTFDRLRQRVDVDTGSVIEEEHTQLNAALEKDRDDYLAMVQINNLERRQLRAMRDVLLRPDESVDGKSAADRIADIDDEISQLREKLADRLR